MKAPITLKRPAVCKQCGTALPAGTRAKWYRNGDVYGLDCHTRTNGPAKPIGQSQEDWICSDAGYEYQMERAAERANGRW